MLEVSQLAKVYRTDDVETHALSDVSLSIAEGEFVAIMGPSGCGKSSLHNILGFLDRPSSGSYRLHGEEVGTSSEAALTRLRREHVGFVFQSATLIDELIVEENVEVSLLYRKGARAPRTQVADMLDRTAVGNRGGHRPSQLSGGQQQRAAISRALAAEPAILLADEPTGNLDSIHGEAVVDLLRSAARGGTTVIMVTHSPANAAAADRVIEMLDGRIVAETRL
jgi:putative ABC transport system ATP-binding protein